MRRRRRIINRRLKEIKTLKEIKNKVELILNTKDVIKNVPILVSQKVADAELYEIWTSARIGKIAFGKSPTIQELYEKMGVLEKSPMFGEE
jgi:hypothetical protein